MIDWFRFTNQGNARGMSGAKKNRPENRFRTATSPLVVRYQINWPVSGGLELRSNKFRVHTVSGERASGGSCEASRSPFGGGAVLP
jgi:hypothetical protein